MKKQTLSKPFTIAGAAFASTHFSTNAAVVQIDLINNQITAGGGNQLFSDIDYDGAGDIVFSTAGNYRSNPSGSSYRASIIINSARERNRGSARRAIFPSSTFTYAYNIVNGINGVSNGWVAVTLNSAIIGTHQGFLEIRTDSTVSGAAGVYIERFVFDDASATTNEGDLDLNTAYTSIGQTSAFGSTVAAVPEPSSLALLAAGAGGLMLRRRREKKSA